MSAKKKSSSQHSPGKKRRDGRSVAWSANRLRWAEFWLKVVLVGYTLIVPSHGLVSVSLLAAFTRGQSKRSN